MSFDACWKLKRNECVETVQWGMRSAVVEQQFNLIIPVNMHVLWTFLRDGKKNPAPLTWLQITLTNLLKWFTLTELDSAPLCSIKLTLFFSSRTLTLWLLRGCWQKNSFYCISRLTFIVRLQSQMHLNDSKFIFKYQWPIFRTIYSFCYGNYLL